MKALHRPMRALTVLVALTALSVVAGCGRAAESSGLAADDGARVLELPSRAPSPTASDYAAPIMTMGTDGLQEATQARALSVPAFERAMSAYCTDYYAAQRDAEEKYLGSDRESQLQFALANAANARRTERQLHQLTPPAELASIFQRFVDNAERISEDRRSMLQSTRATGGEGQAGSDLDAAVTERWALATQLHASGCDGKLPPAQEAAAVNAARAWATTTDPVTACRDLVSPWIVEDQATCVRIRTMENTPPYALPEDIQVTSVTGVEELSATVKYLKVGGCACSPDGYVRLFFVEGAWLVNASQE
jgi:hypothetical protein